MLQLVDSKSVTLGATLAVHASTGIPVPANEIWEISRFTFLVVTSATVGNRSLSVQFVADDVSLGGIIAGFEPYPVAAVPASSLAAAQTQEGLQASALVLGYYRLPWKPIRIKGGTTARFYILDGANIDAPGDIASLYANVDVYKTLPIPIQPMSWSGAPLPVAVQ